MFDVDTLNRLAELLGSRLPQIPPGGTVPYVIVPESMNVHSLEDMLPPQRIKRLVTLIESGSFIDYVNRFKTDNTLIFANVSDHGASIFALLDYHGPAPKLTPAHVDHKAQYNTICTKEWKDWREADRKVMNQVQFATWVEEHLELFRGITDAAGKVLTPTGAELLELVQTLEGKSDVRFNSAIRLQSGGSKLAFDEDVTLKGQTVNQSGFIEVPKQVGAGIKPFEGSGPAALPD
jgi:uncharacterized protein YfdQ (DUF2303 family)